MLGVSNAYTLTVRQAPERGKAFSGPKEKDRKPVDPPPIVQLQIRDPQDPASNYLQSPYFFMACNLCDADLNRPGQLAAALQGEDTETASQSSLAGTLVSSLHRLKDIDNSDGGFFVFPDVSVRLEGEFRLRFSLFEMLKTAPKVIYIKSVHTEPFTVYSPRTFPGMSESTFLSRSFGDQGVKLRIRKEPRTLGKRAAPSDPSPSETPQPPPYNPQRANYAGMGIQPHQGQGLASDYREEASGYAEPLAKRLKPAIDLARRDAYIQEERSAQRAYAQQRDPYPQYREGGPILQSSYYAPQPSSARSAEFPLIGGHQRTISSSASSMLESPRGEYGYNYVTQSPMYQQPRDPAYQYQYRQTQQMPQAVPPERQLTSSIPVQSPLIGGSYGRTEEQPYPELRYQPQRQASMYLSQPQQDVYGPSQQSLPRTLPALSQGSTTSALPSMSQDNPTGTLPPLVQPFQQTQYPTTNGGGGLETFTTSASGAGQGYSNAHYAYRGPRDGN